MLAVFWGALGASAVCLALLSAFCLFGAILVVRPTPTVSLRAVAIGVGCAATGFLLAWASARTGWFFGTLASASTVFATVYLFARLASMPDFEPRDLSAVVTSVVGWCVWIGAIGVMWTSQLPGISETKDFWVGAAETVFG